MDRTADVAIIGGGIVGLAHAYMALKKKLRVVLFERNEFAVGASIRNFGLLWPIGQEPGNGFETAMRSREHWNDVASQAGIWCQQNGSLHVVYHEDELEVLHEFLSLYKESYACRILTPEQVKGLSPVTRQQGLLGGLYSESEGTVYSRDAIRRIPLWLEEKFGLKLRFGHTVKDIHLPYVKTSLELWNVKHAIVCSGADFETLYPKYFDDDRLTKCKLQMMKVVPEKHVTIGPSLCAGLTLRHYHSFSKCKSLVKVHERYDRECLGYKEHGIHVLVSQNHLGELIVGDSHHYGNNPVPFDSEEVNELILRYFESFVDIGEYRVTERWNGVYPKFREGNRYIIHPEPNVTIVNGLGGAGMTLSFGVAEEVIDKIFS
jgi:D-hydroxyproline dehydrogenase subunit beta